MHTVCRSMRSSSSCLALGSGAGAAAGADVIAAKDACRLASGQRGAGEVTAKEAVRATRAPGHEMGVLIIGWNPHEYQKQRRLVIAFAGSLGQTSTRVL